MPHEWYCRRAADRTARRDPGGASARPAFNLMSDEAEGRVNQLRGGPPKAGACSRLCHANRGRRR
jgi:hypothetical protein